MFKESELLEGICEVGRRLHDRNLLAAGDGNISHRLADGRLAITPAGVSKARLKPKDLAILAPDGQVIVGRPSTERYMHLAVYRACPEACCVIHAHPPTAIAWTVARPHLQELPAEGLPEVILAAGRIPIVPYARPGTEGMGKALEAYLPDHRLLLLARHGALCWGGDLEETSMGIERVEHVAQILKYAVELGGICAMEATELAELRKAREMAGPRIL